MNKLPRPEYPRPQFVRADGTWQNLNGEWEFYEDYSKSGEERKLYCNTKFDKKITLPFCRESELSGINNKDFCEQVWYRRDISIPKDSDGKRIILHVGACDWRSKVWVDGIYVGTHIGGYVGYELDITDACRGKESVSVVITAIDLLRSANQAGGKQSSKFYSHGCSYTRTTGIWQTVWLEVVPEAYIRSMRVFPNIDDCKLNAELKIVGGNGKKLEAVAYYDGKEVGRTTSVVSGKDVNIELLLSELHLWEVGHGRLYDLVLKLDDDEVKSYFGMRKVEIREGILYINEKPVFQRLVLDQGFYPDGIYTASSTKELEADIDRSLACGFNGARLHQKIFEPEFLTYCDKKGYIVWGEHGNWGLDISRPEAWEGFIPEWLEALERDFNHPAIIGWCPLNETQMNQNNDFVRAVAAITRAFDNTRGYIDASGWTHIEGLSDIVDIHDYDQNVETFKARYTDMSNGVPLNQPKRNTFPLMSTFISEYGGIRWSDGDGWGYGNAPADKEEFINRFHGLTEAIIDCPVMGGLCYTQLTDVEQEQNGLYTYDRKPKFPPETFRKSLTKTAYIEKESE